MSDGSSASAIGSSPSGASDQVEGTATGELEPLARNVEALLFLAPDPLTASDLASACEAAEAEVIAALHGLMEGYLAAGRGILLRQIAGGWSLSSNPEAEEPARRLFAAPRTPPLSAAQAETLAIVAYLQPVSRPEIARIRGVNAESAVATLLERGLVEESGRSPFGAVLYRTGDLFLRLFGLESIDDLPDIGAWDPAPEVEKALRERLLEVGALRAGEPTTDDQPELESDDGAEAGVGAAPVSGSQPDTQSGPAADAEHHGESGESTGTEGGAAADAVSGVAPEAVSGFESGESSASGEAEADTVEAEAPAETAADESAAGEA